MFSSRAVKNNVIGKCYEEYMIDFADRDRARADEWVFGEVEEFFKTVRTNSTLHSKLKSDKLVFFLHLLGKVIRITRASGSVVGVICVTAVSIPYICNELKQTSCKYLNDHLTTNHHRNVSHTQGRSLTELWGCTPPTSDGHSGGEGDGPPQ